MITPLPNSFLSGSEERNIIECPVNIKPKAAERYRVGKKLLETYILVSKQFTENKWLIKSVNQIKTNHTNICLTLSLDIQFEL